MGGVLGDKLQGVDNGAMYGYILHERGTQYIKDAFHITLFFSYESYSYSMLVSLQADKGQ